MTFMKPRLDRRQKVVGLEIADLGDEGDVGYRSEVGRIGFVKPLTRLMTGTRIDLFWADGRTLQGWIGCRAW